jgi:2-oxoglutarate ferredoxin oxidoreductase subunit beta
MDECVFVSGIGCAGWIPSPYFYADTLHTTHGRPIAFATGVKLMRPDLNVMVISGDGDLAAIGGNHLIHAARRNIGLVTICVNNAIYGMTGGQVAPTTPVGVKTVTTPWKKPKYASQDSAARASSSQVSSSDGRRSMNRNRSSRHSRTGQNHEEEPPDRRSSSPMNRSSTRRCSTPTSW